MAPSAIDSVNHQDNGVDIASLKARSELKQQEMLNGSSPHPREPPPVADNYMYDFKYNHPLPTFDQTGVEPPQDCDVQKAAEDVMQRLSTALEDCDAEAFADLFLEHGT